MISRLPWSIMTGQRPRMRFPKSALREQSTRHQTQDSARRGIFAEHFCSIRTPPSGTRNVSVKHHQLHQQTKPFSYTKQVTQNTLTSQDFRHNQTVKMGKSLTAGGPLSQQRRHRADPATHPGPGCTCSCGSSCACPTGQCTCAKCTSALAFSSRLPDTSANFFDPKAGMPHLLARTR